VDRGQEVFDSEREDALALTKQKLSGSTTRPPPGSWQATETTCSMSAAERTRDIERTALIPGAAERIAGKNTDAKGAVSGL
jgi:hypothetical protein